jgi:TonB-linked SusC/RagA family outer membrane protein
MKKFYTLTILLICLINSYGQEFAISGKVIDANSGEPLPGVNIRIEGTTRGVVTNPSGEYSIRVSDPEAILIFSYLTYLEEKVKVGSQRAIDISMVPDIHDLEEVIVIGYGKQKKSDITGSVASINPEDVNPGPVLSVDNILQNTAPGVVLIQSSAQPGGGFDIKVRGTSSLLGNKGPLYVIDGMPVTSENSEPESTSRYRSSPTKNPLNGINPDDIVSIEILKDASATAIYGARGANGVILITTKNGKTGKIKVDYAGSYSLQQLDKEYDMLDAKQFATVSNQYHLEKNPTSDPLFSPAEINRLSEGTAWMDEITRLGAINKHQLSFYGGKEKFTYYVSTNYFNHKGIVEVSGLQRFSGRLNAQVKPIEKLKIGVNIVGTNIHDIQVPFGATQSGGPEFAGLFDNTRNWSPLVTVYQPDGSYSRHPEVDNIPNPVSLLEVDDQIKRTRFLGTTFVEYALLKKLTVKLNLGYDQTNSNRESYIPTSVIRGEQANGEAEIANKEIANVLGELTMNYISKWFGNEVNILGGATFQQFDSEGNNLLLSNFADYANSISEIQRADTLDIKEWKERSRLISYLGRINYSIRDRYLFTFSFRADGSTKFGPNNKWGYFPSGAFAWKVHKEDFFNLKTINSLKIRLSYGQIGNQEIGNKRSQSLYSYTRRTVIGGRPVSGLASLRPQNDDLKWETSTQFNAGIDVSVLEGRIQSNLDIYHKITSDVLLDFYLPSTSGYEVITSNAGKILNKGAEFGLKTVNISEPFKWSTSFNIAFNKNNWLDRAGYYPVGKEVEKENAVVNGIYGYVAEGIFKKQEEITASNQPDASLGMIRFKDINGDGNISPADRTLLGKKDPDFTFGLNNQLTYKRFDLSFFFQGMLGREKDNYTLADLEDIQNILSAYNKSSTILDRWTQQNQNGNIHSGQAPSDGGDNYNNSIYIQDASFVRLRNVTLGYTLKSVRLIDYLRIYVDAQNLLTFTKYEGLDPETDEFRQYPNAKTYSLGVNVTF